MKKMIVLDAEKRGGKHGKTSNKGDKSSPSSPKGAARGVVVADALYPRERIRMACGDSLMQCLPDAAARANYRAKLSN